jgi:hypothetical protein
MAEAVKEKHMAKPLPPAEVGEFAQVLSEPSYRYHFRAGSCVTIYGAMRIAREDKDDDNANENRTGR